jgi:hypothetical protein
MGQFSEIQTEKPGQNALLGYDAGIYVFTRWSENQRLLIITNFQM